MEADLILFAEPEPDSGIVESYGDQWPVPCIDYWVYIDVKARSATLSTEGWIVEPRAGIVLSGDGGEDAERLHGQSDRTLQHKPSERYEVPMPQFAPAAGARADACTFHGAGRRPLRRTCQLVSIVMVVVAVSSVRVKDQVHTHSVPSEAPATSNESPPSSGSSRTCVTPALRRSYCVTAICSHAWIAASRGSGAAGPKQAASTSTETRMMPQEACALLAIAFVVVSTVPRGANPRDARLRFSTKAIVTECHQSSDESS